MAYKEKECRKCGVKHTKRGEYCSRSCGNQKQHTNETRQLLSQKQTEWLTSGTDEADVAVHNFTSRGANKEPEPIAPITKSPIKANQFVQDGDLWTTEQFATCNSYLSYA